MVQEQDGGSVTSGVDVRLLRVAGRAELALLVVTWPFEDPGAQRERLDDLAPRLAQFAADGDVCEILLVLRSESAERTAAAEAEPLAALTRLVDAQSVPVTVVVDGVTGADLSELVARCARVVLGRSDAAAGTGRGAAPAPHTILSPLTGSALVDAAVHSVREQTDGSELSVAPSEVAAAR